MIKLQTVQRLHGKIALEPPRLQSQHFKVKLTQPIHTEQVNFPRRKCCPGGMVVIAVPAQQNKKTSKPLQADASLIQ